MTLLRRLIPAVPRIPWVPVLVIIGLLAWATISLSPDFASRQLYLRAGFLVAALGLSFAFDDPAAPTTDSMPSPLRRRRCSRLILGLLPWVSGVAVLIWAGSQGGLDPVWRASLDPARSELPVGRLILEATTMAAGGFAIASVITKRWDDEPGKIASATLLGLYALSWMVPERWKPWSDPTDLRWETVLPWWWLALVLFLVIGISQSWDTRQASWASHRRRAPASTSPGMGDPEVPEVPTTGIVIVEPGINTTD